MAKKIFSNPQAPRNTSHGEANRAGIDNTNLDHKLSGVKLITHSDPDDPLSDEDDLFDFDEFDDHEIPDFGLGSVGQSRSNPGARPAHLVRGVTDVTGFSFDAPASDTHNSLFQDVHHNNIDGTGETADTAGDLVDLPASTGSTLAFDEGTIGREGSHLERQVSQGHHVPLDHAEFIAPRPMIELKPHAMYQRWLQVLLGHQLQSSPHSASLPQQDTAQIPAQLQQATAKKVIFPANPGSDIASDMEIQGFWDTLCEDSEKSAIAHATYGAVSSKTLVYDNAQQAERARLAHLPRHTQPFHDPTRPTNDQQRKLVVAKLIKVMVTMDGVDMKEDSSKRWLKVWESKKGTLEGNGRTRIEQYAWQVEAAMERYFEHGGPIDEPLNRYLRNKHDEKGMPVYEGPGAFQAQLEDVCAVLRHSKTTCVRLVGSAAPVTGIVDNPRGILEEIANSKKTNTGRAKKAEEREREAAELRKQNEELQRKLDEQATSTSGNESDEQSTGPTGSKRTHAKAGLEDQKDTQARKRKPNPFTQPGRSSKGSVVVETDENIDLVDEEISPSANYSSTLPVVDLANLSRSTHASNAPGGLGVARNTWTRSPAGLPAGTLDQGNLRPEPAAPSHFSFNTPANALDRKVSGDNWERTPNSGPSSGRQQDRVALLLENNTMQPRYGGLHGPQMGNPAGRDGDIVQHYGNSHETYDAFAPGGMNVQPGQQRDIPNARVRRSNANEHLNQQLGNSSRQSNEGPNPFQPNANSWSAFYDQG